MMLPLLLASLVDLAPGLVWVDPSGVLPASVDPVPTESLRATRALAGEHYGVFSAATERYLAGDSPKVIQLLLRDNNATNDFDEVYFSRIFPRLEATNRTVRTTRIVEPSLVADARTALTLGIYSDESSTRFPAEGVPTFAWTTNWTELVEINMWGWMQCAPRWVSCAADPILNPEGGWEALFLFEHFPEQGEYTGGWNLDDIKNYEGYAEPYRCASPAATLDAWLAELYPADPPTASLITNNTLRLDRKRLTAMDYACALYDLRYAFSSLDFARAENLYTRSRSASALASAEHFSYSFSSGGYSVNWSPAWTYQTNLVVATNYVSEGYGEAELSTSGCTATNGHWSAELNVDLVASYETITNVFYSTAGVADFIAQYQADATVTNISIGGNISVPAGFDFSQPAHGLNISIIGLVRRSSGPIDYNTFGSATIVATETNAQASAYGQISRFATLTHSSPQSSYEDYDFENRFAPRCQLGIVSEFTAYPLCVRFTREPTPPGWAAGDITHIEWQLPASGLYAGTNGYLRLKTLQAGLACDDAAAMCARDAGHDIRDVDGYLALPDYALEATKTAAADSLSNLAPQARAVQGSIVWDFTENIIQHWVSAPEEIYHVGDDVPLGSITATASGDAGSLTSLPEAHGFAERNIFLKIPLHFLNCRDASL